MAIKEVEFEGTEYHGWDAWFDKFKPVRNTINKYSTDENPEYMFETYGAEVEHVQAQDPKYVWTFIDGDMSTLLVAGYHFVNRLGYYIATVPWDSEWDSCLLSVEVECECYDEQAYGPYTFPNGHEYYEDGDRDCKLCEGYGLKTEYVNG